MKTFTTRNYYLPREWVETAKSHSWEWTFHKNGFYRIPWTKNYTPVFFLEEEGREICRIFLEHTDKGQWPLLMGISPVMDQALGQKLRGE